MRRLVPADAAFFATADPESLLFTGGFAEEPLGTATPLFLDNEFGAEDVNKFAALATSSSHVASLDSVTLGDRFASPRYREIMRPLGLGDELRVALLAAHTAGDISACTGRIIRAGSPRRNWRSSPRPLRISATHFAWRCSCTVRPQPGASTNLASSYSPTT